MKKFNFLLILLLLSCTHALSQISQVKIVSFQVKNTLPAKIDDWASIPAALILTAQKTPGVQLREPKMVVQIRSNGAFVCGNNQSNAQPISPFDVKTFTTNEITGLLSNCKELKEGSYQICVQFFNLDRLAISNEVCKEFKVESAKMEEYAPPTLITPDNGKSFTPDEMKKPLQFRWTPLVPKPKDQVTYRLKVWQLMQGQNANAAMRANNPLVEKDVRDITQTVVNGSSLYTGPCRPPYLCDFIWQVQALNKDGKPIGRNNGMSETYSFKVVNNIDIQIDSLKVGCCVDGKQSIYLKVRNNLATAVNILAVKYKVNGVGASINLSPITPGLTYNLAGNGTVTFTSSINCIDNLTYLKFLVEAEDVADPDNKETEVKSDTLHCACNACDELHFTLNAPLPGNITITNNLINFNQPLTITTNPAKTVKSITAELVYFEMVPENDWCIPCNKDAATYGHFNNGTNSIQWGKDEKKFEVNITTPQLTPCCSAVFKWCIRYKVEFTDCTSCNKLVCYEKKKEGCEKVNIGTGNPK